MADRTELFELFIKNLAGELGETYKTAHNSQIDWCPCCGLNLRLYDERGRLYGKLIIRREQAVSFAKEILRQANQMQRHMPNKAAAQAMAEDFLHFVGAKRAAANPLTEKHRSE